MLGEDNVGDPQSVASAPGDAGVGRDLHVHCYNQFEESRPVGGCSGVEE